MAVETCVVGRGVAAVRHKSGSRSYTYYVMKSQKAVFDRFEAEGTVFGSINKNDFHALLSIVPRAGVIPVFERIVSPLDDRIANNENEIGTITVLRDSLLPKLVSGELQFTSVE